MLVNYFINNTTEPNDNELEVALGPAYSKFEEIFKYLVDTYKEEIRPEWKQYSKKMGWQLKIFKGKRNILFIVPFKNSFIVYFVFGDKAVQQVMESDLPEDIKTELQNARKYMEGRGINISITEDSGNVDDIKKLIKIKLDN